MNLLDLPNLTGTIDLDAVSAIDHAGDKIRFATSGGVVTVTTEPAELTAAMAMFAKVQWETAGKITYSRIRTAAERAMESNHNQQAARASA